MMAPSVVDTSASRDRLTYKLLKTWKAKDLKQYLKDHGLSCTGRKDDLIDRVCLAEGISRSGTGEDHCSVELESKRVKILPTNLMDEYRNLPKYEQIPCEKGGRRRLHTPYYFCGCRVFLSDRPLMTGACQQCK